MNIKGIAFIIHDLAIVEDKKYWLVGLVSCKTPAFNNFSFVRAVLKSEGIVSNHTRDRKDVM